MKRPTTGLLTALLLCAHIHAKTDTSMSDKGKCFVGTSAFILMNLIPNQENPPGYFQLNLGYWITDKDVLSLEAITWKYREPLGIPYGPSKNNPAEAYPGTVRDWGIGVAYQRYFWRGLYAAQHITPLVQRYEHPDNTVSKGFMLFMATRAGYHFRIIKKRFFVEPSVACTYWPIRTSVPEPYKVIDHRWPSYFLFEPGLHLGFTF